MTAPAQGAVFAPPAERSILLIAGMPRSGTTLLSNLVQDRFNIPVAPETHFFDMALQEKYGLAGLPAELREDPRLMAAYEGLPLTGPADPVATFRRLLDRLLPDPVPLVAEKTPDHLMHLRRILPAAPETRALVILRNCADVCESLARMPWNDRPVAKNAEHWRQFYRETLWLSRAYPDRVAVLRYESLCARPAAVLDRAAARIGLRANPQPVTARNNYDPVREPWKRDAGGAVRRRRAAAAPAIGRPAYLRLRLQDPLFRLLLRSGLKK